MSTALDYYFSKRPFMKNEVCADLGVLKEDKDHLFFAIADVAGHGDKAHELSLVIKKYFVKNYKKDLVSLMSDLHILLMGSRGAVALAGFLTKKTRDVEYVGIGNISVRKLGRKNTNFISSEGILGYTIPTPKIIGFQLGTGDRLLLYTDGIQNHFDTNDYPKGLFDKDAKHIANGMMKYFYKGNDDAGCIAIRYQND